MADANPSGSPLETVADRVGEGTTETFELLANETRLAILLALWEAVDPGPPQSEAVLPFSELRDRVGVRHGQQFTYHLDRLTGEFVRETDEGYALTARAHHLLETVLAGTLGDPSSFDGGPIDEECPFCGASVVVDYDESVLFTSCPDCERAPATGEFWHTMEVPPAGLDGRTPGEVGRAARTLRNHRLLSMRAGVCPMCAGTVTASLWVCPDHDAGEGVHCERCGYTTGSLVPLRCDVCKFWITAHPFWFACGIPEVRAFFHDHGIDLVSSGVPTDALGFEVRAAASPELRVGAELDGDRLDVTVNEAARVVEATRSTT